MSNATNQAEPSGARFYACDLHAHTPTDRGWLGERPQLGKSSFEAYAGRYVEACQAVGLEALALVDHNFARSHDDSLEPWIQKKAREKGLVLFPGVELASSEGVHVMVVFDPCEDFRLIDRFVTAIFGSNDRFAANGSVLPAPLNLEQLLEKVREFEGFFYFPHANNSNGLFKLDSGKATAKKIYEEKTPLLALDLGDHPLGLKSEVVWPSRIPGAVAGFRHSGWKREGQCRFGPALLWNSDGRALPGESLPDGTEGRCRVGDRFTWIKMSEPSVFALKCAALDPESRLRYPQAGQTPSTSHPPIGHSHLASVRLQGVEFFQQPLEMRFSPHLNCIIGGRGSGKSNLLSLLRYVLRQDTEEAFGKATEAKERHQGLLYGDRHGRKLLSHKEAVVTATFLSAGQRYTVRRGLSLESRAESATGQVLEGSGVTTLCRAKVFSQGQIEEIARQPALQLTILDDFLQAELRAVQIEEEQARNELIGLQAERLKLSDSARKLQEAGANLEIIQNKLKQLASRQDAALKRQQVQWQSESRYFERTQEDLQAEAVRLQRLAEDSAAIGTSLDPALRHSPRVKLLTDFEAKANALCEALRLQWKQAADVFARGVAALMPAGEWQKGHEAFLEQWQAAESALTQSGLKTEDAAALRRDELQWQRQVELLEKATCKLVEVERQIARTRQRLLAAWRKGWELRRAKAEALGEAVQQRIEIIVGFATDQAASGNQVAGWLQGSGLQEEPRQRLCDRLVPKADRPDHYPLFDFVTALREAHQALAQPGRDKLPETHPLRAVFGLSEIMAPKLGRWVRPELLDEIERYQIPDLVQIAIRDREETQPVPLESASFGQLCAAVLSLLLAEGDEPILIDQPEDNLDNEGIYQWIVQEVFRVQKFRRQLIVATHNANIVVNGDAEMVIALERKKDESGVVSGHLKRGRNRDGKLIPVTASYDFVPTRNAVAEVLEGGERAFELRGLKYGMEVPRV